MHAGRVALGLPGTIIALMLTLSACSAGGSHRAAVSPGTVTASDSPASCAGSIPGKVKDHGTKPIQSGAIAIEAGDSFFSPTCVVVGDGSGDTITITLANTGAALHNFSINEQKIDRDLAPGTRLTVTVRRGESLFYCKYHSGAGMKGAFIR